MIKILIFIVIIIAAFDVSSAAKRHNAREALTNYVTTKRSLTAAEKSSFRLKRGSEGVAKKEMTRALNLDESLDLEILNVQTSVQGTKIIKMQEKYKGKLH